MRDDDDKRFRLIFGSILYICPAVLLTDSSDTQLHLYGIVTARCLNILCNIIKNL